MDREVIRQETFLEPADIVVKASRVDNDLKGLLITSGSSSGILGTLLFATHLPVGTTIGAMLLAGAGIFHVLTLSALKHDAGDYLEMISPRRREVTRKEALQAWSFLPGKGSSRIVDTFYVDWKDGVPPGRLKSGLARISDQVEPSKATHRVVHELRSSWRGLFVVQHIEPLEGYSWDHAFRDITDLYGIKTPGSIPILEVSTGMMIKDHIRHIEQETSK